MEIYINSKAAKDVDVSSLNGDVLYQNTDVLIIGEKNESVFKYNVGDDKQLILVGTINALFSEKSCVSFNDDNSTTQVIQKILSENEIEKIIDSIEGRYIGLILGSDFSLTVFADKFNCKELYYTKNDNELIASTSIKNLVPYLKSKKYDQAALANILSVYGSYAPKKHTIYKDIRRLGVGENISLSDGNIEIRETKFIPDSKKSYTDEHLEEYAKLFRSSVEIRSSKDSNWVYMSSGWDSSSVLSVLCEIHGPSKIKTVIASLKCGNKSGVYNLHEIERAKKITDYFGVSLDIVEVDYTSQEYLSFWNEIREDFKANHLYALFGYNFFRLAQYINENGSESDAIFNGEISDGAHNLGFSQYATILNHPDLGFREYSDKMASYLYGPSFFERISQNNFSDDIVFRLLKSHKCESVVDSIDGMSDKEWKNKYIASFFLSSKRLPFSEVVDNEMLSNTGKKTYKEEIYSEYFDAFSDNVTQDSLYAWMLHLYNSFHWQGGSVRGMLTSPEHYNMQNSSPFWDTRIQKFLSAMPESWGRGLEVNPTKYPLKWMLKNKLDYPNHLQVGPHSYLYDEDPSWSVDADIVYDSAGTTYFKELLKNHKYKEVLDPEFFNLEYINNLVDDYCQGKVESGQRLTDLKNIISLCNVGWY